MKSGGPVQLVFVLLIITWTSSMPAKEPTTRRPSQPQIGDTIKQLTSQLMNVNGTPTDITFDTRTPPKVKQQIKKLPQKHEMTLENSHPGVAVPVEESDLILEESTKKFNFYKLENKPTTDRGLSTWVLLNSHTVPPPAPTMKTSWKPVMKQKSEENKNSTAIDAEIFNKITKPLFKKRPLPTTTRKPSTTTVSEKEYKLTKIKASVLTNALNNKNKTETTNFKKPAETSTTSMVKKENSLGGVSVTMEEISVSTSKPNSKISTSVSTIIDDNELIQSIEAKDDEIELMTTTQSTKKTRRPTTKRKKNKKRRRPSIDKSDTNSTKLTNKVTQKEKPISTQIYNYLSRELIPTVGVGLVGLVVTAGLASYFLYPFGIARRSYEVDRKDKEGTYYYNDEYGPGGVAEEEVIGKVIAGMPGNSNNNYQSQGQTQSQSYRSPTSRDAYSSMRYKQSDYGGFKKAQPQATVEAVYLTPSRKFDEEVPHRNYKQEFYSPQRNYNQDIMEHSQEIGYTVEDKQFVVGNIPKEIQEATPAVVPEHGPRNLPEVSTKTAPQGLSEIVADYAPSSLTEPFGVKPRKRRSNDLENEIDNEIHTADEKTAEYSTNTPEISTTEENTSITTTKPFSFINTLRQVIEFKIRIGLELLQSATRSIARYLSEVQTRFNNNYNNSNKSKEQPRMH